MWGREKTHPSSPQRSAALTYRNFLSRVLKVELETYKIRVKVLQEENRNLRQASVIIVRDYLLFVTKY